VPAAARAAGEQRRRCALDARRRSAVPGEDFVQALVDLHIAGDEPAVGRAQKITLVHHVMAGRVRMDYSAAGVDEEYCDAQAIQRLGKCRGFGLPAINRPVDGQRAMGMRCDLRNAPPHFVVEHAGARKNRQKNRATRIWFFEQGVCDVDTALGPQPILIEGAPAILVIVDEVRNAHDLPEGRQADERIESGIRFRIELDIMGIDTVVIKCASTTIYQVLLDQPARPAADKVVDADDNLIPQCGFESRIVDFLDQVR
jgi:hypothetical protein